MVHDISDPARGLVADITPWRHPRAPVRVSVAQGASGFHARYLASVFGVRAWQANWVTSSVLPAAVELRVEYDSVSALGQADRAAHALLAVPMTIMLGARR